MDTPIINPMILYLIDVVGHLKIMCGITLFVLAITLLLMLYFYFIAGVYTDEEDKKLFKTIKYFTVSSIIVSFLLVVLPSSATLTKMYVASFTTAENIELLGDTAKDTIDYIVDKIDEAKDKDNEK